MALTASQRRQLARRTTPTSRARLQATFRAPQVTGLSVQQAPAAPRVPPISQAQPMPQATPRTPAVFAPDAQYIAEAAQKQFDRTNQVNQLNADADTARTMHQEAVRRLMEPVPEQRQQISQQANKQGLFYSGVLGKRLSDMEAAVARQRADLQASHDAEQRAREAARTAILNGGTLEDAALQAAAVERQITRDQEAAANNSLARNPPPKPRPKPKPKPKPRPRNRR